MGDTHVMDSEPSVCERNGLTPNTPTVCEPTHVKNMNMNKEVATRLFRMLAVSEQTANTVKHDEESLVPMLMLLPEVVATPPETIAMSADCEMSEANVKPVADIRARPTSA